MAYVLSLRPHSPLKRSFSDNPYLASCSPLKDATFGALHDITPRNASACSLYSLGSNRGAGDWLRGMENTPPPASCSLLDLVPETDRHHTHAGLNNHAPRKRSCGFNRPAPSLSKIATPTNPYSRRGRVTTQESERFSSDPSSPEPMIVDNNTDDDDTEFFDLYEAIHIPLPEGSWSDNTANEAQGDLEDPDEEVVSPQPFRRWMSTLRRRHIRRHRDPVPEVPSAAVEMIEDLALLFPQVVPITKTARRFSDSLSSSLGCITAIHSASITVASASIAPRSDTPGVADKARLGKRSSHYSEARKSTESHGGALSTIIDEGAWLRSAQRRKVVEELISTEESYISDLKVLVNVSFLFLAKRLKADVVQGLFHGSKRRARITSPYTSSYPTKYLSDSAATRRLAC